MTTRRATQLLRLRNALALRFCAAGHGNRLFQRTAAHGDIDEGESSAAESLVAAEDKRQIAADLRIGERKSYECFGAYVLQHVGARNESYPDVGGDESLQQLARVKFHRNGWS